MSCHTFLWCWLALVVRWGMGVQGGRGLVSAAIFAS